MHASVFRAYKGLIESAGRRCRQGRDVAVFGKVVLWGWCVRQPCSGLRAAGAEMKEGSGCDEAAGLLVSSEKESSSSSSNSSSSCSGGVEDIQSALQKWPSFQQILMELERQGKIGASLAAMNLIYFTRSIVCTVFLGHLGGLQLAGGTLALTYANVTGFSLLTGLSGGMEPICSQAYGARHFKLMGLTLQRGILILLLTCVPVTGAWLNIERVLTMVGQDAAVAAVAKTYLKYLIPDLVATCVLAPLRIYLRSQCITKPMMVLTVVAMAFHAPVSYLLVYGPFEMGAPGTALASFLTDLGLILMLVAYIRRSGVEKVCWSPWSKDSFMDWSSLLTLAIPSCLMTCLEWWCYEIMTLLTGFLPNAREAISTMAIVLNGDTLLYAMQISLASCVCTRVGNELGANRPIGAYHASVATLGLSAGMACVGAFCLICARSSWGKLFTSDKEILLGVAKILPIMGLMELGNFPQTVCCGVLRGSARPKTGAYLNGSAFYLVGIPVGVCLAFGFKLGLLGLWIGLLAAVALCACMAVFAVIRTDWISQATRAQSLTLPKTPLPSHSCPCPCPSQENQHHKCVHLQLAAFADEVPVSPPDNYQKGYCVASLITPAPTPPEYQQ